MNEGRIPLAGVVGAPVAHSRSPALHGYWLQRLGLAGHYVPLEVGVGDFAEAIRMLPRLGFVGVNVTIPHKRRALELADAVSDRATLIGAANTLVFREGRIHADNTDAQGFLENLRQQVPGWQPAAAPVVVLGGGGAARAVVAALLEAGVGQIIVTNRTRIRAEQLQDDFGARVRVSDWLHAGNLLEEASMVVNTTALGMAGKPEMRIPLDGLRPGTIAYDLVYNPLETRFLREARARGCVTVDGLGMLIHQAVPAFERFFGARPPVDEAVRAVAMPPGNAETA